MSSKKLPFKPQHFFGTCPESGASLNYIIVIITTEADDVQVTKCGWLGAKGVSESSHRNNKPVKARYANLELFAAPKHSTKLGNGRSCGSGKEG